MNWFKKLSWATGDVPDNQFVARLGPRWSNPSPGKFVLDGVIVTKKAPLEESNEPDSEAKYPDQDTSTAYEVLIWYPNGIDPTGSASGAVPFRGTPEEIATEVVDYENWEKYIEQIGVELEADGYIMDDQEDWYNNGSFLKVNRYPLYTVDVWFKRAGMEAGVNVVVGSDAGNMGMALDEDRIKSQTMRNPTPAQILEQASRLGAAAAAQMEARSKWLKDTLVLIHESYYKAHAYKAGPNGKESDTARMRELQAMSSFQNSTSVLIPMLSQAIQAWIKHHEWSDRHKEEGMLQSAKYALRKLEEAKNNPTNLDASMTAISLSLNAMHVHGIVVERLGLDKKLLDEINALDVSKIDEEASKIASWVDRNCRIAWYHAEKALEQAHEDWMGEEESSRKPPVQRKQPTTQNAPPWDYKHVMALSLADGDEALAAKIEAFDDASLNFLRDIISAMPTGTAAGYLSSDPRLFGAGRDRIMLALSNGKINPSNIKALSEWRRSWRASCPIRSPGHVSWAVATAAVYSKLIDLVSAAPIGTDVGRLAQIAITFVEHELRRDAPEQWNERRDATLHGLDEETRKSIEPSVRPTSLYIAGADDFNQRAQDYGIDSKKEWPPRSKVMLERFIRSKLRDGSLEKEDVRDVMQNAHATLMELSKFRSTGSTVPIIEKGFNQSDVAPLALLEMSADEVSKKRQNRGEPSHWNSSKLENALNSRGFLLAYTRNRDELQKTMTPMMQLMKESDFEFIARGDYAGADKRPWREAPSVLNFAYTSKENNMAVRKAEALLKRVSEEAIDYDRQDRLYGMVLPSMRKNPSTRAAETAARSMMLASKEKYARLTGTKEPGYSDETDHKFFSVEKAKIMEWNNSATTAFSDLPPRFLDTIPEMMTMAGASPKEIPNIIGTVGKALYMGDFDPPRENGDPATNSERSKEIIDLIRNIIDLSRKKLKPPAINERPMVEFQYKGKPVEIKDLARAVMENPSQYLLERWSVFRGGTGLYQARWLDPESRDRNMTMSADQIRNLLRWRPWEVVNLLGESGLEGPASDPKYATDNSVKASVRKPTDFIAFVATLRNVSRKISVDRNLLRHYYEAYVNLSKRRELPAGHISFGEEILNQHDPSVEQDIVDRTNLLDTSEKGLSLDYVIKLVSLFGSQWSQWVNKNNAWDDPHRCVAWIPESAWEVKTPGLADYLMKHGKVFPDIISNWDQLSPEQRNKKPDDLYVEVMEQVLKDVPRQNPEFFRNSLLLKGPQASDRVPMKSSYEDAEKSYMESLDVPPLVDPQLRWKSGPLTGRFLPRNDHRGIWLGILTGCCQYPGGVGEDAAHYGQSKPNAGFFVVEDPKGRVVAQSMAWCSGPDAKGARDLVFDNIEGATENKGGMINPKLKPLVMEIYKNAARDLLGEFRKVTVGKGYSKMDLKELSDAGWIGAVKQPDDLDYSDADNQSLLAMRESQQAMTPQESAQTALQAWVESNLRAVKS